MTLANQDDRSYARRLEVKASAARRPTLNCGCPNDGRLTYLRGTCDHIVCGVHADGHECGGEVAAGPLVLDEEHTHTAAEVEHAAALARTWEPRQTSVTPAMPSSIQEGDVLVAIGSGAMAVGRAGETTFGALMADLEEGICIECGRLRYEHQRGSCPPLTVPDQRSWLSRLRGWLRG